MDVLHFHSHIMKRIRMFFAQWIRAVSIFPVSFVVLLAMAVIWVCMVYSDFDSTQYLQKLMFACLVALPLSIISPLQAYIWGKKISIKNTALSGLWVLIGIIYYVCIPADLDTMNAGQLIVVVWWVVLSRMSLLLIIAWEKKYNESFTRVWRKELLSSVVMWGIAWWIIWGGISACLISLEYLFWVDINSHAYAYVGVISMTFITWAIALIHIVNQERDDKLPIYSRSMRIFGHYIFLPLTILYGCILISYGIKILITWVRPEGRVVYMVAWYVWFWLLTWLTTYPALPNPFIAKAHRVLFISFFLTSFLMIRAIQMRIEQYWLTTPRYFVCAIIAWIMLISIGSLIFTKRRYMIMITTLVVLWIISVYGGPLNAVNTSSRSQKGILVEVLAQNNISLPLTSWSLANVASWDTDKIYDTIYYIADNGNIDTLHTLLPSDQLAVLDAQSSYMKADYIVKYAGLNYYNRDPYADQWSDQQYFSWDKSMVSSTSNEPVSISWYTSLYDIGDFKSTTSNIISVYNDNEKIDFDLSPYGEDIYNISRWLKLPASENIQKNISVGSWWIMIITDAVKLILTNVSWYKTLNWSWDTYTIQSHMGYMLVH